jgi:hypothetical protein
LLERELQKDFLPALTNCIGALNVYKEATGWKIDQNEGQEV